MNLRHAFISAACALCAPSALTAAPVNIPTVLVGNPGNASDPSDGNNTKAGIQHFGGVSHLYRIGTTEVTNAQYAEFLNFKAASDPLGLYNTQMGSDARGGILRSGSSGSFAYTTKANMGDKPVSYVSWYDSIRFANWLNNGQGSGDTEAGAYTLLGGTPIPSNGDVVTRNSGATWFLPSEDEWYKAAFHQPATQGGDIDDYWRFATASNSEPVSATANSVGDISNPGYNVANYLSGATWNGVSPNVTTVGSAGALSKSYYGTSDQNGNVWEWNEVYIPNSNRGLRGGSRSSTAENLEASYHYSYDAFVEDHRFGFRVATIPEPSTVALATIGLLIFAGITWRQRVKLSHRPPAGTPARPSASN